MLRHIQEEHPENYLVFETVANLKGLKLKNLITRPTLAQSSTITRPDGEFSFFKFLLLHSVVVFLDLMIFNPCTPNICLDPNFNTDPSLRTNLNLIPGQSAKMSTTSVQRQPHHAAKSCQPVATSNRNYVPLTKRVSEMPCTSAPIVSQNPTTPFRTASLSGELPGRSDHEYSTSTLKRSAPETKSPISPTRKTKKQQAEAISKFNLTMATVI